MPAHGKKYREAAKQYDATKRYDIPAAVALLKQLAYAKFDETVTLAVRLGVDPRNADQQVRGTVALPHGTGQKVRVAVFATGDKVREATEAGADVVGGEDLVKKVLDGFLDFDAAVATPDMMRHVGRLGKVLGPRNLMPNPKVGTVTMNVSEAVKALKAGQVEYKLDKYAVMNVTVGKKSFTEEALVANIHAVIDAVAKAKPASAKGQYFKSAVLCSTMSPGFKLGNIDGHVDTKAA